MRRFLRRFAATLLLLAPTCAAAVWSARSAALALYAVATEPAVTLAKEEWKDPARLLEVRRQIQKHFLDAGVYLPLEDIVAPEPHDEGTGGTQMLMQKACGRGRLFIWIPFKFKLPITGEKVIEWCWKPQTKDA